MLIETLATSRASSLGPSVVYSSLVGNRPALKDLELGSVKGDSDVVKSDSGVNGDVSSVGVSVGAADDRERKEGDVGGDAVTKQETSEKMGRKEWMMLIEAVFEEGKRRYGMFGKVESSFKVRPASTIFL